LQCATSLGGIGKAMLIYSNDYNDELPRAGGPNSKLGSTPDWKAKTAAEAYGLDDGQGEASMSANMFLLVKFAEVTPKSFRCQNDRAFKEFNPADYNAGNRDLVYLWDFGPDPAKHVSFSYHTPYGQYALTNASDPGMAVAADRNPWLRSPGPWKANTSFPAFDPNGPVVYRKRGNALTHNNDGQNVLFLDSHTAFEKLPFCGVKKDNIYTPQTATDIRKGALPTITSQPTNKTDSLLLHDAPKGATK